MPSNPINMPYALTSSPIAYYNITSNLLLKNLLAHKDFAHCLQVCRGAHVTVRMYFSLFVYKPVCIYITRLCLYTT